MATSNAPITIREVLKLPSIGINPLSINFTDVKMESDKYICVRETASVVIIDMNIPYLPLRMSITADSAMMNPNSRILAFKNQLPGTTCDYLKIFDIEMDTEMRSHQMPKQIVFWQWITPKMLGLVTQTSVYHWSIQGDSQPVKMFDRTANLTNNQIISYRCDPAEKWLVLIGIAPGTPERPQLIRGNMQLFSVDQQRSQALEAHSASFASFKVSGNENPSTLVCFASKTNYAGQITSKLFVIELGPEPGKQAFTKKQADLLFPPDFIDDFPVAMQISHKYGLIYVITKLGLLFVYDLETVAVVYRFRISSDPIFLTLEVSSIGGFYAVNRRGQLLLVTVNEATIVPFVSGELNNRELAVNIARRGNLPEAENLICQWFQELFSQAKYKEAAELAVESPQGILRTPDTLKKFQSVPVRAGQTPPLLLYFGILLTRGKLDAFESLELSRLVVNQNKNSLLKNWLAEDKLECSEELSNLVKTVDNDLAQEIYIKARDSAKVVAASADSREFEKILILSTQVADNDIAPAKSLPDECLPGESSIKRAEESTQGDFGSRKPSENSPDDLKRDSVKGRIVDEIQKELSGLKIDHHQDFDVRDELNEEIIETVEVVNGPKEGANGSSNSIEMSLGEVERKKMRRYSNRDLTSITKNFTDQVGSGAYGDVFKGKLPNGVQVAVKKLKDIAMNVMENTFMAEVRTMSNTSHRNLVRLYGYCFEASMKALVYEYLENGSLDKVLYENHLNLQWDNLYDIAIGTAVGLSYLHEGCDDEIVHYDVKPGNVLLDSKLSPKVADFGMAKISERDLSHISVIEFRGTRSYAAPEMWMQMPVTSKSDIYSFGMMLFEVLGRRRNLDNQNWLPGQVWEKFKKEKLDDIMEECGIEDKNKIKAKTLCIVALWCTQYRPNDRPIMSEVVQLLKGNIHRPSPPDPYYPYSASSGSSSWGGGSTKMSGPSIVSSTLI